MAIQLGISVSSTNNYISVDSIRENRYKKIQDSILPNDVKLKQQEAIAKEIKQDIERNLKRGIKYSGGGKVAKLKPSTIKRKGHSRVFLETGKLFNSVVIKKLGSAYIITFKPDREQIAGYLIEGNKNMAARPFFGVTKKRVNELIKKYIKTKTVSKTRQKRYNKILVNTRGAEL